MGCAETVHFELKQIPKWLYTGEGGWSVHSGLC